MKSERTHKFRYIVFVLLVIGCIVCLLPLVSHGTPPTQAEQLGLSNRLTILTWNTHQMGQYRKPHENAVLQYLLAQDADVICLQEVDVYKSAEFLTLAEVKQVLGTKYPYSYIDFSVYNKRRQFGNMVWSRYPLINKKTVDYEIRANLSSRCDVLIGEDTIRLIVNHLESFHINNEDLNLEDLNVTSFQESTLGRKLIRANKLRREQVSALCKAIRKSPYPIIAVGDFNSLPISWVYWRMNLGLRDCFAESSFGQYGGTYQRKGVKVRIDYIFLSRSFKPIECYVGSAEHSDHYPVISTIGW